MPRPGKPGQGSDRSAGAQVPVLPRGPRALRRPRAKGADDAAIIRGAFETIPAAVCVLAGPELIVEVANDTCLRVWGTSREQAVGRALLDAVPALRGQGYDDIMREVLRTGHERTGSAVPVRLGVGESESETWWDFVYRRLSGSPGKRRVVVLGHDVTEQVLAQRVAAEHDARFANLVAQVGAGIVQIDLEGRIVYTNERYRELVGRTRDELQHLRMQDLTHPDDVPGTERLLRRLIEQGTPFVIEKRYVRPDGSLVWVQNSVTCVDDAAGRPRGVVAVCVDISDRRVSQHALEESEARSAHLAEIVRSSQDAIVAKTLEGTITSWNEGAERLFGYRAEEALGRSISLIIPTDRASEEVNIIRRMRRGERVESFDTVRRRKDGSLVEVSITVSPVRDSTGRIVGASKVARDISTRRIAEAEREARLEAAERELSFSETFVGVLGHDLRTPLAAILAAAGLLRRAAPDDAMRRNADRIESSAGRMGRMIEQILDLTRARLGGGIPVSPSEMDLASLVAHLVAEQGGDSQRTLQFETTGDTRGWWDADRLAQVVSNLVANALAHGDRAGVVRIDLDGSSEDRVRLAVWNPGAIPPGTQETLFDPFRRGKTNDAKGLGLGLYIVQQIVQAHRGSVILHSSDANGTTFTVTLPRTPPAASLADVALVSATARAR